jgi:hypothetical protein
MPDGPIPLSATPSSSSYGIEEGLQSPSLLPAPLPVFNSFYYFDHLPSTIPGSPRSRAVDLPTLEGEIDSKADRFGLGLHSTGCSW